MTAWTQRHLAWIKTACTSSSRRRRRRCWITSTKSSTWPSASSGWSRRSTTRCRRRPPRMRAVIEALQALRGIAQVSAVTIVAEVGELSRFAQAPQLMGYSGVVPREHSSGERTRRGGITKTGNAHLRRIVVEAAWAYRHRPSVGAALRKRQRHRQSGGQRDRVESTASACTSATASLTARGKCKQQVVTAVGRELLGSSGRSACRSKRKRPADVGGGVAQRQSPENGHVRRSNGGGRGAHGKENPRARYAAGLRARTRALSPRQLPTDHDHAVPTREYQSDQPSR